MKIKIKIFLSTALLLVLITTTYGQSKFSEIEKLLNFAAYIHEIKIQTETIDGKTYEIWLKDHNNSYMPKTYRITGSGFLVYTDTDFYLITTEHIAKKTSLNTNIVINSAHDTPIVFKLSDLILEKKQLKWTTHSHADVSVIQLDNNAITEEIFSSFLPFKILNPKLEAPFRERKVTVFGYPLSLGIGKNISPITKTLKPASGLIELPRFDNKRHSTFFLLDDPSVSGFSGGPVFELPQQIGTADKAIWVIGYRVVGLVHGTISDKSGGFSAIVPSIFIKETIEAAPGLSDTLIFKYEDGSIWSERIYKNGVPWTVSKEQIIMSTHEH